LFVRYACQQISLRSCQTRASDLSVDSISLNFLLKATEIGPLEPLYTKLTNTIILLKTFDNQHSCLLLYTLKHIWVMIQTDKQMKNNTNNTSNRYDQATTSFN